jgi:pimeloyl-ACP methyl ester carboxylesterase
MLSKWIGRRIVRGGLTLRTVAALGALLGAGCVRHAIQQDQRQEATMKSVEIAGPQGKIAVSEFGAGAGLPLLFLHADSGRASQWSDVARALATSRRALAFDFRGGGQSAPARDGDYSYTGRADDVAAVADALLPQRFVIVAHSGGAAVALEYAARHATRVAGLLLVDPPTDPRALPRHVREGLVRDLAGPNSLKAQQDFYRTIVGENPTTRARVLADCEAVVPAARAGIGAAFASWNPESALSGWHGPTRVLVTPPNDNEHALHQMRRDLPHRVIGGTGHWIQLDQPAMVERSILEFVAVLEGTPG